MKSEILELRVTKDEKKMISDMAIKYNKSISETLHIILFDHLDIEKPLKKEAALEIARNLRKSCNNSL